MATLNIVQLICNLLIVSAIKLLVDKGIECTKRHERNADLCKKFSRNPFFEYDLIIGKPWRIYYIWDIKIDSKCVDITYKNVTKEVQIIQRIWSDMNEYLENQPNWNAAALLANIGISRHELLLLADQGPAGRFLGVPNVMREGNIPPLRKTIPLIQFHMKLIANGKYLMVMDCQVGHVTLSSQNRNNAPTESDIARVASELELGNGYPACTVA